MLADYVSVLKKTHSFAKKMFDEEDARGNFDRPVSISDMTELFEQPDTAITSGLQPFLENQDIETINVIRAVMYLGRDYLPETEEEYNKRIESNMENPDNQKKAPPLKSANPDGLLKEWLSYDFGSKDKNIAIDQICEKFPLYEYLEQAFEILGITE